MNTVSLRHRYDIFLLLFAALFFLAAVFSPGTRTETAEVAEASHNAASIGAVSGWAWSDTIGWVSMAHTNCDANGDGLSDGTPAGCPAAGTPISPYNLNINISPGGDVTGFAWSSNLGWIDFDTAGPYPTGAGTTADHAKLAANGTDIVGWARACSVFATGCSGTLKPDSERGGWDGWIAMAGTAADASAYGVKIDSTKTKLTGRGWGSDIIGWLDFAPTGFGGVNVIGPLSATCTYDPGNSTNPESTNVNTNVTWAATATGGTGIYTYSWNLTGATNPASPHTANPQVVQYTATADANPGTVTVASGSQTASNIACTGKNSGGSAGIKVLGAQDFSLKPKPLVFAFPPSAMSGSPFVNNSVLNVVPENNFNSTVVLAGSTGYQIEGTWVFGQTTVDCSVSVPATINPPYNDFNASFTCASLPSGFVPTSPRTYSKVNGVRGDGPGTTRYTDVSVVIGSPIAVSCTYSPDTVALGDNVTWVANATGGQTPYSYSWLDDVSGGSGPTEIRSYLTVGKKQGRVSVTGSAGSGSATSGFCASATTGTGDGVQVGTPPTLTNCTFSPSSGTTNTNIVWTANGPTGGNGSYTYAWTLGGATAQNPPLDGQSETVRYATVGNYNGSVTVTSAGVTSNSYTCADEGNPLDTTIEISGAAGTFSLGAAPSSLSITTTGSFPTPSKTTTIGVSSPQGVSGDINLSAALPPALVGKATVTFTPASIPSPYSATSNFNIRLDAAVPNGSYPIVITGANAGTEPDPTLTVTLFVNTFAPSFKEQ